MNWRIAKSLDKLLSQLNQLFPNRSKVSDGGIGNAEHASRDSDHNPWLKDSKGQPIVTARDFTFDDNPADGIGIDCQKLADVLVKNRDPRIKYIIWNRQICSSKQQPWTWRPYAGKNAHKHHLHLSVMPEERFFDDVSDWKLDFDGKTAVIKPAVESPLFYVVQPGNTVSKILKQFGLTMQKFNELNGFDGDNFDPDNIQVGQQFKVK